MERKTPVGYLIEAFTIIEPHQQISAGTVVMICENILNLEKMLIKESYNAGYRDCDSGENCLMGGDISQFNNAELYFNKTYKQNKIQ